MQFRLRTLLILLAVGPPFLAAAVLHIEAVAVFYIAMALIAIAILVVNAVVVTAKNSINRIHQGR